jgi:hypothetical protein
MGKVAIAFDLADDEAAKILVLGKREKTMTSPQSQDNPSIKQTALENVTVGGDLNATIHQNITIHQGVSAQSTAIAATLNTALPTLHEWQGRQDEIKELQTALSNDKIRLIGMTAAGGYGKSALAAKFKEQLTPNWRVLWVNFIQPYPLAQFGRWLLEKLGRDYDEKWDEETLIGQIVAGLIAEHCLLVLDNMEVVIPAEGKSVYSQFLSKWLNDGLNSKIT